MKKRTIDLILFVVILFALFLLPACSREAEKLPVLEIGDGGLLSGMPCAAPCFLNIIPGTTSEEEAVSILGSLGDIASCDSWNKVTNGIQKGIGCENVSIYFDEKNIVNQILFVPSESIMVSDVVDIYGTPDSVIVLPQGVNLDGPYEMQLLFYNEKILINLPTQGIDFYDIEPTTNIISVGYSDKSSYEKNINELNQQWVGYGKYR
jgi:hypothetical protein